MNKNWCSIFSPQKWVVQEIIFQIFNFLCNNYISLYYIPIFNALCACAVCVWYKHKRAWRSLCIYSSLISQASQFMGTQLLLKKRLRHLCFQIQDPFKSMYVCQSFHLSYYQEQVLDVLISFQSSGCSFDGQNRYN